MLVFTKFAFDHDKKKPKNIPEFFTSVSNSPYKENVNHPREVDLFIPKL